MNKKRLVLSSLAAFGLVALSLQPANAQNFLDYLRGVVRSEGGIAGNYGQIQSNINMALSNSNARINVGVSNGRINPFEARQLHNELNTLEAMSSSMGRDGIFTTAEVNTIISQTGLLDNRINSFVNNGNNVVTNYRDDDFDYGYGTDLGYNDMPYFDNFNSVYSYQQAMLNQLNAARISEAQRQAWRNQYNILSRQLTRDNLRSLNRQNSRNNAQLRQLVRLNNQIRNANRVAQNNFHNRRDNDRRDNNRSDFNNRRDNDRRWR
jgi:hypothetical protein